MQHLSEEELEQLYNLARRFVEIYQNTAGLTHIKDGEMEELEALQHEFIKIMDQLGINWLEIEDFTESLLGIKLSELIETADHSDFDDKDTIDQNCSKDLESISLQEKQNLMALY